MTGKVSDGPTSYAVLQQVPGGDLEHIPTDFIKERLRHIHLGGSGRHLPPGNFWIFYSLKPPHSWVSESFRQDISKCSTWNFFPFKIYPFITDFLKKLHPSLSSSVVSRDLEVITGGIRGQIS